MPTIQPFADLLRLEARLRTPLGATYRVPQSDRSFSFQVAPYFTLQHEDPYVISCTNCEAELDFQEFPQDWGVELQVGMRYYVRARVPSGAQLTEVEIR